MSFNRRPFCGRASLTLYLLNALVSRCLGLIDCFAGALGSSLCVSSSSYDGINSSHAVTFCFGCLNLLKAVVKLCFGFGNFSLNCANNCFGENLPLNCTNVLLIVGASLPLNSPSGIRNAGLKKVTALFCTAVFLLSMNALNLCLTVSL